MADSTWSVRLDDDTKQDITNLLNSSGEQGKEFVQSLITAYKIKKAEESQPLASQDLKDLQMYLTGIQNVYYNLSMRIDTKLKTKDSECKEILTQKDIELNNVSAHITELEENIQKLKEDLQNNNGIIDEQNSKINEFESTNDIQKELINEYKNKNKNLEQMLNEYKTCETELENLKEELITEKNSKIAIKKQKEEAIEAYDKFKIKYNEDIQKVKDECQIESKQEILDIQKKHQEEINELHAYYNKQIQELLISFGHNDVKKSKIDKGKKKIDKKDIDN